MEPTTSTLWMGAIQPNWTESFIKQVFLDELNEHVEVKLFKNNLGPYDSFSVQFAPPRKTTPIGYAFVEFRSPEVAKLAKEQLENKHVKDTNVLFRLNWAMRDKKKVTRQQEQSHYSCFVGDLSEEVTNEMLEEAFKERFPTCTSANVVVDPTTGHSKKYGFVRFSTPQDQLAAIQTMNGQVIGKRAIRVGPATAKQNEMFLANQQALSMMSRKMPSFGMNSISPTQSMSLNSLGRAQSMNMNVPYQSDLGFDRSFVQAHSGWTTPPEMGSNENMSTVFVGNLDSKITEEELTAHFSDCGEIISVKIPQYKKGCGFITFSKPDEAQRAITTKEKSRLGESKIRLDWGREKRSPSDSSTSPINGVQGMNPGVLNQPGAVNMVNLQDMSTLKYMNNMNVGMGQPPTFAYNYNYISYMKPPASYGFYNYSQGEVSAPQNTSPVNFASQNLGKSQSPPLGSTQGLNDVTMGMSRMNLATGYPMPQQHHHNVSPNGGSPNGSPPGSNLNFSLNGLSFNVQ